MLDTGSRQNIPNGSRVVHEQDTCTSIGHLYHWAMLHPDLRLVHGTVAMSSANGLVGTGFASQYQLQPRAGF